ncbi:MAG: CARDB domain-containing protein [Saprospiraceae bacterium]
MRLKHTLRSFLFAISIFLFGGLAIAQADISLTLTQQPANPQQYTTYTATATISNDGPETATNVAVSIPLVAGVVYTGGSEFSATSGTFTPYNNSIWTLDSLSAGTSETITLNYFLRIPTAPSIYGQVISSDQSDPDSSPSNGTPPTVNEDDESTTEINGGFVPDLTLSNLSLTQNPVDSGEQIDFTFDINNIGTGSIAQNFLVQAYISVDDQLSPDDLQNGTVPTGNFAPGQTVAGVMGASLPVGLAPGSYFLILEVDANGQVLESNETNNTVFVPLTIESSTPPACTVDIQSSVYCDDNGTPQDPSDDIAIIDVLVTNPGASSFTIDAGSGGFVATGDYGTPLTLTIPLFNNQNRLYSYIVTDNDNPTNCVSSFSIVSPSVCSPDGPDLQVSALQLDPAGIQANGDLGFTFDLSNLGATGISQTFLVQAFLSVDSILSSDDIQNGTVPTGGFGPTQAVSGVVGASNVSALIPGDYYLILFADANRQVAETLEDNNTSNAVLFTISDPATCEVVIATSTITCDDNATPQDPSDDQAVVEILATNAGGTSFTVESSTGMLMATGSYGTPITFTIPLFNNQNSLLDYVVLDDTEPATCTALVSLTSPSVCSPDGPDLQVSALQLDPAGIQANGDLGFTFDLTNAGATAISQTFLVQAFLSVDTVLSTDDIQNGTVPTGSFGPAQTVSGVVGASNVSALTPGDYYLILLADANRQVAETLEDNNTSNAIPFTIAQPVICEIALSNMTEVLCNDNGTPLDPADDFAGVQLQASNGSAGGLFNIFDPAGVNVGGGAYGRFAGMTILNLQANQGTTIEYTLVDASDTTCTSNFSLVTPAPCSNGSSDIDLEVSITQDPGQPAQYSIYTVTANVTNTSSQTATGVVLDLPLPAGVVYQGGNEYTATQGLLDTYNENEGEWTVGTLPAGQTAEITINYFLRATTSSNSYVEVLAANEQDVDSTPGNGNGQVNEDDEASTLINGGFVPDLTLTNLTLAQNTIDSGAQIDFTVDINNIGLGSIAQNFLVQAYISTDNVLSSDDLQNGTIPTGNFAGGQTVAGVMGASVPVGLAPGSYFLILEADANGQVLESNENNNTISVPFTIEAVVAPTCDIIANVLSVDCDNRGTLLEADDTYSVTFLIANGATVGLWTASSGGAASTLGGSYGEPFTLQLGNISSAINSGLLMSSLDITDAVDTSCSTIVSWQTPEATCSASTDPCDAISEYESSATPIEELSVELNRAGEIEITDRTTSPALVFTFDGGIALGITPVQNGISVRDVARIGFGYVVTGTIRDAANPSNAQPAIFQLDGGGTILQASIPFPTGSFNDLFSFNIIDVATAGANGDVLYTQAFSFDRSFQIAAFDESTNLLWEDQRIGDLVSNRIGGVALSPDESTLYFSYRNGNSGSWPRFRGVNTADGLTNWEVLLGDFISSTAMPLTGDVSTPVVFPNGDGVLGFSATDGSMVQNYAARFDADGNMVFVTQLPTSSTVNQDLYFPVFIGSRGDVVMQSATDTVVVTGLGSVANCSGINGVDLELSAVSAQTQPQQYAQNSITFTLVNSGTETATDINVDVPRPADVRYTGGNEYTASQGVFSPYRSNIWTVGDLAPGATARLVVNYFSRSANGYTQYAEVFTMDDVDVDSTPGNGSGTSAVEDDEVFLDLTSPMTQALTFYPNPTPQGEQLILDFISSGETTQTLIFSDLTGRPVRVIEVSFQEGRNQIPLDLGVLPSGVYVIAFPESGLAPKRVIVQE